MGGAAIEPPREKEGGLNAFFLQGAYDGGSAVSKLVAGKYQGYLFTIGISPGYRLVCRNPGSADTDAGPFTGSGVTSRLYFFFSGLPVCGG